MISRKSALLQLLWQVHTCKCLLVLHLQGDGCFYWLGYHSCYLKIDQWTVLKDLADSIRKGDRRMPLALCSLTAWLSEATVWLYQERSVLLWGHGRCHWEQSIRGMRDNFKVGHIEPFLVSIICKPSVSWPPRQSKLRLYSCTKYWQSFYCTPGESGCKLLGPSGSHKANESIGSETRATESFLKKIKAG